MNALLPDSLFMRRRAASGGLLGRVLGLLHLICMEVHPATRGCAVCPSYMLSLETRACHAIQPEFPVDAIYTWVDGSDPAHVEKRTRYLPERGRWHHNGLEPARFRDNEELRYSLRALEQFAPWIRSVILVTDNQTPAWLKKDHPKIRIVDHREIIPHRYLPTFNSHVIEAWLHNAPGLADHFLYMNDDVFLARPCRKTDFFTPNGLPLAFVDWRGRRIFGYRYTKTPHAMSYFNSVRLLRERGVETNPRFITTHGPYAQTRANVAEAFAFYEDIIKGFAANRFRTTEELAMYSHALPLWIYGKKRLVPCDERYYYVQTGRVDRAAYYEGILHSRNDHAPPLFFCINDADCKKSDRRWREDLHLLLGSYYPSPSSFEADSPTPAPA